MRLAGRRRILTDQKIINKNNIVDVLKKSYAIFRINQAEIQFLIDYERGYQPLMRQKTIRPDINIETCDNLANYVKEFKVGYFWGTPAMLVQRGNNEPHNTDDNVDDLGITALNEMLRNGNMIGKLDQELAEFVEICGIGHQMVDIKSENDFRSELEIDSYVNIYTLDSRNTFCVYHDGPGKKKVLGVTFSRASGKNYFTCFTDTERFDIESNKIRDINPNLFGRIPIVEYERAVDRTGCFERQISLMDNLNVMVSDFANDVAQKTQEIWWGNDIDFPEDENGNPVKPKSGQWLLTYSGDGKNPKIEPMSSTFESSSTLDAISNTRTKILQNCKVPIQYDSEGGGSTGIAVDSMSGWSAAEVDALREEQMIESEKRELLNLILKAISLVSSGVLPEENPMKKVHGSDIEFRFNRKRNYSMSEKSNTFATLVSHGINGRHALKAVDMFEDTQQVWNDSKEEIEKYQKTTYGEKEQVVNDKIMQDSSDQESNSPIVGSMRIEKNK